jgi:hypothetical protein
MSEVEKCPQVVSSLFYKTLKYGLVHVIISAFNCMSDYLPWIFPPIRRPSTLKTIHGIIWIQSLGDYLYWIKNLLILAPKIPQSKSTWPINVWRWFSCIIQTPSFQLRQQIYSNIIYMCNKNNSMGDFKEINCFVGLKVFYFYLKLFVSNSCFFGLLKHPM